MDSQTVTDIKTQTPRHRQTNRHLNLQLIDHKIKHFQIRHCPPTIAKICPPNRDLELAVPRVEVDPQGRAEPDQIRGAQQH